MLTLGKLPPKFEGVISLKAIRPWTFTFIFSPFFSPSLHSVSLILPVQMHTSPTAGDISSSIKLSFSIYLLIASVFQSYPPIALLYKRRIRKNESRPSTPEYSPYFRDFTLLILCFLIIILAVGLVIWVVLLPDRSTREGVRKYLLAILMIFSRLQMGCEVPSFTLIPQT